MAEAVKREEVVKVSSGVTVDMSIVEAKTLVAILAQVGGDTQTSYRKHADSIRLAITDVTGFKSGRGIIDYRKTSQGDGVWMEEISHEDS